MAFSNGLLEHRKRSGRGLQRNPVLGRIVDGIPDIFCHPAQRKVWREVAGSDSVSHSLHNSTSRGAARKNRYSLSAVEAAGIDHRHSLSKRRGLHTADEVVDELHQRAASNRAQMNRIATQNRKTSPRGINGFGRTSDQENQLTGGGMGLGAGDRRIQKSAAPLGRLGRKFL